MNNYCRIYCITEGCKITKCKAYGCSIEKLFYNITAPIFIDNAESITGDVKTGAQTFFMRVREELCPECGGQSGRRNPDGTWTCKKCGNVWKKELSIMEV